MKFLTPILTAIIAVFAISGDNTYGNPYAGLQNMEIKSLSHEEIDGYLNGKGMGFSKVAELNSYPGPRHVLDLSSELNLSQEQLSQTKGIYNEMLKKAKDLGKQFIENEQEIEKSFGSSVITPGVVEQLLLKSGHIQSQLRLAHIEAHIKQKETLTKEQIEKYNELRGYTGESLHAHKHNHR